VRINLEYLPAFPSALKLEWLLLLDLSGMCDSTSSYATAGIALRVSGAPKVGNLEYTAACVK
jgi:hypothetical protein